MGYASVTLDDFDRHDVEGIDPDVLPIGVALRPESSNRPPQREQPELYVPLSGRFELAIGPDWPGSTPAETALPSGTESVPAERVVETGSHCCWGSRTPAARR